MVIKNQLNEFPWFAGRDNSDALPTYKIVARSQTLTGDSIVTLHKAGADHVVNYYIRDLVTKQDILEKMDTKEADLMRWVVNSESIDPLKS